jgi:SagB-type dehydrogenase family enzyme
MKAVLTFCLSLHIIIAVAQTGNIELSKPSVERGTSVSKALWTRASATAYSSKELSLRDLSDLLWAANGINRPESGKRTAPSAMNSQDVDIYVFMQAAVFFYNPQKNLLEKVTDGDYRALIAGKQTEVQEAPASLLLVSDISRFKYGNDSLKVLWGAFDAGIVSENISLFCSSIGMETRCRASMDQEKLRNLLKLKPTQYLMLNHPIAYRKN